MPPSCKKCGRALKNPQSIRYGMGPVCLARELGIEPRPRYRKGDNHPKILKDDELNVRKSDTVELPKP